MTSMIFLKDDNSFSSSHIFSGITLFLILINNYIGHLHGPFSISFTPIVLGLSTFLIFFLTKYPLVYKYISILFVIILNDVLVKLFSGGAHDPEGQGWIFAFMLIGLVISFSIILFYTFFAKKKKLYSFIYFLVAAAVLYAYLSYFMTLGTNELELPAENRTVANQSGLYISDVTFSDSSFQVGTDTFYIKSGWLQSQTRINHSGLFKKIERDKNNYCTIELIGNFDKYGNNGNASFKVNSQEYSGSTWINHIIDFPISRTCNTIDLTIFAVNDSGRIVKSIRIKPNSI